MVARKQEPVIVRLVQRYERYFDTVEVTGSIPVPDTIYFYIRIINIVYQGILYHDNNKPSPINYRPNYSNKKK